MLAIIPARGSSKGIPKKNIRDIAGKPLIYWSIRFAEITGVFDEIHVNTDDHEIAEVVKNYGARIPFIRSADLATDKSSTESVIQDHIEQLESENIKFDHICLLQATSPIRLIFTFNKILSEYEKDKETPVLTGYHCSPFIWRQSERDGISSAEYDISNRKRRQEFIENYYVENGSVYLFSTASFKENMARNGNNSRLVLCEQIENLEIDDWWEWSLIDAYLSKYKEEIFHLTTDKLSN